MSEPAPRLRLYVEAALAAGAELEAPAAQAHYLLHVMRAQDGAAVALFNGRDGEWLARVARAGRRCLLATERPLRPQAPEPGPRLLWAPLKRQATDLLVRAATELGAARLSPVLTRRTVAERVNPERLGAIAVEAAEQSGRLTLPRLDAPATLDRVLDGWPAPAPLLFCDEAGGASGLLQAAAGAGMEAALLVGPEGGFEPAERARLRAHPAVRPATLGPLILRAETAALAALAILGAAQRAAAAD